MKLEELAIATHNLNKQKSAIPSTTSGKVDFSGVYSQLMGDFKQQNSAPTIGFEDIFAKASKTYGVPLSLLKAVAKAESGFNPKAVSSCGAQGIMQLMPKTAKALGVVDPLDPEQNIMGGAKYLGQMLEKYNGDAKLTLAAYNAGSGNVKKYGGVPPFPETQKYISKVLGYANENIDVSQYNGSIKGQITKNSRGPGLESMIASYAAEGSKPFTMGSDATILNGIINQNEDPDKEYLTTMFLLNLMEARNKASSVGSMPEGENSEEG